jgi:MFS family permease
VFFGLTLLVLFMNASISGLLIQPIKRDLGLTDVQAALAIGTAAAALNALFMLPVSRLVDIISRRLIIGVGLILTGISAALAGLSSTFSQLFIVRMIGGIGGSGNAPATFSILADYFPAAKLPKALAVMNIGFYYGAARAVARRHADRNRFDNARRCPDGRRAASVADHSARDGDPGCAARHPGPHDLARTQAPGGAQYNL